MACLTIYTPSPYNDSISADYITDQDEEFLELQTSGRSGFGTLQILSTASKEVWQVTTFPIPFADYFKIKNYLRTIGNGITSIYFEHLNATFNAKLSITSTRVLSSDSSKRQQMTIRIERQ